MISADKLSYLLETKKLIKNAIVAKGIDISDDDTFRQYAELIHMIPTVEGDLGVQYNMFEVTTTASKYVVDHNAVSTANLTGFAAVTTAHVN